MDRETVLVKTFERPGGGYTLLNASPSGIFTPDDGDFSDRADEILGILEEMLTKRRPKMAPDADVMKLVAELKIERGRLPFCLSPLVFTMASTERLGIDVGCAVVKLFPAAGKIKAALQKVGVSGFLMRQKVHYNKCRLEGMIDCLVASLVLSFHDLREIRDITPDAFMAWRSLFRTSDDSRWSEDPWGIASPQAFQCLREFSLAFSRIFDSAEIGNTSGNARVNANGVTTWSHLLANASGVDREWLEFHADWLESTRVSETESRAVVRDVIGWSRAIMPGRTVVDIMTRERPVSLAAHLNNSSGLSTNRLAQRMAMVERFGTFVCEELRELGVKDALWPLVTRGEADKAARVANSQKSSRRHAEAASVPLPPQLQPLVAEMLEEGETGWPGKSGVFDELYVDEDGQHRVMYCPVLPVFFQVLLILPVRSTQLSRLDSGEGDDRAFDGDKLTWVRNHSRHVGFWSRSGPKVPRGYAREEGGPNASVTGIFMNTSKTSAPYVIPWEHPKIHSLLWQLRLWQEKHQPIQSPVHPDAYVEDQHKTSKEFIEGLPSIFPLFRMPPTRKNRKGNAPCSWRKRDQAWQEIMAEAERRWNERNPSDQIRIIERQAKTNQPQKARYTMHGLRVAGLTRLFMAGVPLEILSKLVAGHRSLMMTLYYLKFQPKNMHRILEDASTRAAEMQAGEFIGSLADLSFEEARMRTAFVYPDGLMAAVEMDSASRVMMTDVTIGFCPYSGTRCGDGGPIRKESQLKDGTVDITYEPVEGGERNCIMCRHLVSGPPWITQLWVYGTKLVERFTRNADRTAGLVARRHALTAKRNVELDDRARTALLRQEEALDLQINTLATEQVITLTSIHRVHTLLEVCETIRSRPDSRNKNDLIAQDARTAAELIECSDFERSELLTAASRIWPMFHDKQTEAERNTFIDKLLWQNGGVPLSVLPLGDEQKRYAQDSLSRLILERLEVAESRSLVNGEIRLKSVGLVAEVERLSSQKLHKPMSPRAVDNIESALIGLGHQA